MSLMSHKSQFSLKFLWTYVQRFYAPKNSWASASFKPAIVGSTGQRVTSIPSRLIYFIISSSNVVAVALEVAVAVVVVVASLV